MSKIKIILIALGALCVAALLVMSAIPWKWREPTRKLVTSAANIGVVVGLFFVARSFGEAKKTNELSADANKEMARTYETSFVFNFREQWHAPSKRQARYTLY